MIARTARAWVRPLLARLARPTAPVRRRGLRVEPLEPREVPAFFGGVNVAYGDVNGDGFPDIVAGQASQGNQVTVVNGKDGAAVLSFPAYAPTFTGGVYVATGDVDGDGVAEIITGTGNTGGPHVRVFDGTTGVERFAFFPYEDRFRGGVLVAAADTTGDGKAEIITGTGVGGGPRVVVFDAATQSPIANFFAYEDSFRGGVLVGTGDVTGDGKAEIITGTGVGGGPRVVVFDATTLAPITDFFAYEDSFRGGVLIGAADTDGDGKAEVLGGTGPGGGPVVSVFGGTDAQPRARFSAYDANFRGGVVVTGGDTTGDGKAEVITGPGPGGNPTVNVFAGDASATLLSFSPFDPVQLPAPNPVSVPVGPPVANTLDAVPTRSAVGLTVSQSTAVVGSNQQLVVTTRAEGTAAATRVQLFQSDATGVAGEYLLDLFDDGSYTHRDAASADGTFSNTFTVNFPVTGDKFYLAKATVGSQELTYLAKVTAVARPTAQVVTQRVGFAAARQTQLEDQLDRGVSVTDALAAVKTTLLANPAVVRPETVDVTGRGVYWVTVEGLAQGALASEASGIERAGEGDAGGGGSTVSPMATAAGCTGKALVLAPFFHQFEAGGNFDESDDIAALLRNKGYQVADTYNKVAGQQNVTIDQFKNLGQYDAVIISTHGDQKPDRAGGNAYISSGVKVTADSVLANLDDILAGRIDADGPTLRLTPAFFEYYSGQMNGTVVYFSACRGARDQVLTDTQFDDTPQFAHTFVNNGAAAYVGYSDYVDANFASPLGVTMFQHLLNDKTVGTIPGAGKTAETDDDPARFRVFGNDAAAKLAPKCDLLANTELVVTYTWPTNQRDLDTGTTFLGGSVGFACGGSEYMTFSGDDTTTGGREVVTVDLFQAFQDGKWSGSVGVDLRAGWYSPAEGSGPATVSVALRNKTTGELRGGVDRGISPGSQSGCAVSVVGTATITVSGAAGQEAVSFSIG